MDVSGYMDVDKQVRLKYKCPCKHSFSVILERRIFFRKEITLAGSIIQTKKIKYPVTISNLSRYGLKIIMFRKIDLAIGDRLHIEFTLDDKNRSVVFKEVIVRNIHNKEAGVEFPSHEHYDKFGAYLLYNLS